MGSILLSGLRDQTLGENGAQELNNGKKIGINWSRIYHACYDLEILARVFVYLPPFISLILDFICQMVLIFILIYFEWRDTENQQY